MKKLFLALALAVPALPPCGPPPQTVTLSVPGMTCAACPITVKKALSKVEGVDQGQGDLGQAPKRWSPSTTPRPAPSQP